MTNVKPALAAKDWVGMRVWAHERYGDDMEFIRATMAIANDILPDSDPQKLTWEMADAIRGVGLLAAADAIESLLPPRSLLPPDEGT